MTGQDFKDRRVAMGISQTEIAKRAGVSWRTIKDLEQTSDIKAVKLIEAYGLGIMPFAYDASESIDEIESMLKRAIEQKIGRKCKVKISVELCGKEEE